MTDVKLADRERDLLRSLSNEYPHLTFRIDPVLTSWGSADWSATHYLLRIHGAGGSFRTIGGYRPLRALQLALLELAARDDPDGRKVYDPNTVTSLLAPDLVHQGWTCESSWGEEQHPQNKYQIRLIHPDYKNLDVEEFAGDVMDVIEDAEYEVAYRMAHPDLY